MPVHVVDRRMVTTPSRCPVRHPYNEAEDVERHPLSAEWEARCLLGHTWKVTVRWETDDEMRRRQRAAP